MCPVLDIPGGEQQAAFSPDVSWCYWGRIGLWSLGKGLCLSFPPAAALGGLPRHRQTLPGVFCSFADQALSAHEESEQWGQVGSWNNNNCCYYWLCDLPDHTVPVVPTELSWLSWWHRNPCVRQGTAKGSPSSEEIINFSLRRGM